MKLKEVLKLVDGLREIDIRDEFGRNLLSLFSPPQHESVEILDEALMNREVKWYGLLKGPCFRADSYNITNPILLHMPVLHQLQFEGEKIGIIIYGATFTKNEIESHPFLEKYKKDNGTYDAKAIVQTEILDCNGIDFGEGFYVWVHEAHCRASEYRFYIDNDLTLYKNLENEMFRDPKDSTTLNCSIHDFIFYPYLISESDKIEKKNIGTITAISNKEDNVVYSCDFNTGELKQNYILPVKHNNGIRLMCEKIINIAIEGEVMPMAKLKIIDDGDTGFLYSGKGIYKLAGCSIMKESLTKNQKKKMKKYYSNCQVYKLKGGNFDV